ncbi:WG repeat-containing protein [Methylocapsa sp. S129]|uniref:WG repeat-containing protein n=1 Tax=Methylocapsa sp. S129 TaxID=1641869 RepID=UPI00131AB110|nr:WG repeat-containing protein [Methylocapsa sp. S129]
MSARFALLFGALVLGGVPPTEAADCAKTVPGQPWTSGYVPAGPVPFVLGCSGNAHCLAAAPKRDDVKSGSAAVNLSSYSEGALIVGVDERPQRFGFIDDKGAWISPPLFLNAKPFCGGLAPVMADNKLWGYVDRGGKLAVEAQFGDAAPFADGLAAVRGVGEAGKWGFIGRDGALAIPEQFDAVGDFSEGLAPVRIGDRWGYLDRKGSVAIPAKFAAEGGSFSGGRAIVSYGSYNRKRGSYTMSGAAAGIIDENGAFVVSPPNDDIEALGGGLFALDSLDPKRSGGEDVYYLHKIVDKDGRAIAPDQFDSVGKVEEDLLWACRNDRCGFFDPHGRAATPFDFLQAADFSEGLAGVQFKNRSLGFIDNSGRVAIPASFIAGNASFNYGDASGLPQFHSGLASVACGKLWGIIDKQGRWTVAPVFPGLGDFQNGIAIVTLATTPEQRHIGTDGAPIDFTAADIGKPPRLAAKPCGAPFAPGAAFAAGSAMPQKPAP